MTRPIVSGVSVIGAAPIASRSVDCSAFEPCPNVADLVSNNAKFYNRAAFSLGAMVNWQAFSQLTSL